MKETDTHPPSLASFGDNLNVAVIGSTGAIGSAFARHLIACPEVERVACLSRRARLGGSEKALWQEIDILDEASIVRASQALYDSLGRLHLVLVATGRLHDEEGLFPEKTWRHLCAENLEKTYRINAVGPALVAKHFLPLLAREGKTAFAAVSARVGSIEDNRLGGWHAYRASKAALNMLLRCHAVELKRKWPKALCVGLHPGTVVSALSAPFQAQVPREKLFSPDFAAGALLSVLDSLGPEESGRVFAWDGQAIPY